MRGSRSTKTLAISLLIAFSCSPGGASGPTHYASLAAGEHESQAGEVASPKLAADLKEAASKIAVYELPEAEALLKRILEEHPQEAEALMLLGVIHAERLDNAGAEDLFRQAIKINPQLAAAHENLALLLVKLGRPDESLHEYEMALKVDPGRATAKRGLTALAEQQALAARAKKDPERALSILLEARDADPHEEHLLFDLGMMELEMSLNQDALLVLREAHSLDTSDLQTLYALARAELAVQEMPSAEQHMRDYLRQRPGDPTAHYGLGRILRMLERSEEARKEFERSVEIEPAQSESYYELGDILLNAGEFDQAAAQFQKALNRDAHHGGALTGMGIVAYRQKRYDAAEGFFKAALESSPKYQPAHYYYGLVLKRLGRVEEANHELQIALELDKEEKARRTEQPHILGPSTAQPEPPPQF
jgi:tetratricopeptide (TPR) repeat protein